jgi:hypothetical protein
MGSGRFVDGAMRSFNHELMKIRAPMIGVIGGEKTESVHYGTARLGRWVRKPLSFTFDFLPTGVFA